MGSGAGSYREGEKAPKYQCFQGPGQHRYCENAGDIGYDCSGFMWAIWQKGAGKTFPCPAQSSAIKECSACATVSKSALIPCDMLAIDSASHHHVVMYIGDNKIIESSPKQPCNTQGICVGTQIKDAATFISNSEYSAKRCPW
jgi:cell wall-associated NlpC family hydrolase